MKGTKEMARVRLFADTTQPLYGKISKTSFRSFVSAKDYLYGSKWKDFLDPWVRFKFFSSAKFNQTKYEEDK
jgi:outer membrane protein insertion porin family